MELDELKKSWNALNEQLQKEPIADEQRPLPFGCSCSP